MTLEQLPLWAVELIAAAADLEAVHSAGGPCLAGALEQVPDDVRAYAAGFARGKRAAVNEIATEDAQ